MTTELKAGKRYIPEVSQKEIEELRKFIKSASIKVMSENIERMRKTTTNRLEKMKYFYEIADLFGKREKEIRAEKEKGKKVIGYFCPFVPTELILAADAIPVRVSSGWYDSSKIGDRIVPIEVCPIVRSNIGTRMIGLSPYVELSDAIINPLTCDGMTKLSEILSDDAQIWTMCPPRIKDDPHSRDFWTREVVMIKERIEELTGTKITAKKLRQAIKTMQNATRAFRRLQDIRKGPPVLIGRDTMLVNQTSSWDDIERWTKKTEELCDELEKRAALNIWACTPDTPRVMVTGTPMIWPDNWKIPHLIEEAKPHGILVADELCSSERLLYDPVGIDEWTMDDMVNAISERYLLASTCPCFTSEDGNEDRINWLLDRIKEFKVNGVIYQVVRGCMPYAIEYTRIKRILDRKNIPIYYLDTEYTHEDEGQIKTRIEAFLEILHARNDI